MKIKTLLIFIILSVVVVSIDGVNANVLRRQKFDVVAVVNSIAITKYDLDNLLLILKDKKLTYERVLEIYIDTLKKRIVAENNGVTVEKNEKNSLWSIFSSNFKTTLLVDEFCEREGIDKNFLLYFLEGNYLWLKYVELNLKRDIKVSEDEINSVFEYFSKDGPVAKYNLSEIVLHYKDHGQRREVLKKINNIYDSINKENFGSVAFTVSQSNSAKNNGLVGWLLENELNTDVISKIRNVSDNSIVKPFCIGKESGTCFIFMVNEIQRNTYITENEKTEIRNYVHSKILEQKIRNLLFEWNDKIVVVNPLHVAYP
ncbi:MAG: peptidyl-prolyl cis-trans isomerase [Rickettsiales bacterium]|jgi:hypothetical protein|nr:peptidyl-prolyl cis-trans isomerase [Rickettsiales bacterium]